MQNHYQQTELSTLIDLLAKETEMYTKALGSGKKEDIKRHKERIDALVIDVMHLKMMQRMSDQGTTSV